MTWVILPGMDGTGELVAPFVALCPPEDACVVVRYPRERVLTEREILAVIDEFLPSFGDYVLVAESFSGQFAIRIAARKPARLRGLVLVTTFADCPVNFLAKIALLVIGGALMSIKPPRWVIRRLLLSWDAAIEEVGTTRQAITSVKGKVLASRLRMVLRCDVEALLANINVATLVIGAAKDKLVRRTVTEKMRGIPNSELVSIDSPHLALFSRPREIWEIIRAQKSFGITAGNT